MKNEEDWVEKSIRSVLDVADDIVAVDNGSEDGTLHILESLEKEAAGKLRSYSLHRESFLTALNFAISHTSRRWILRWNGDFIARTTGPFSISQLFTRVKRLDPGRYFCIWIAGVSLDGDLWHQIANKVDEPEPFVFTYHPSLHYFQAGRYEALHVPAFYKRLDWREFYYFHMRYVKSAKDILFHYFRTEWMGLPDKTSFPTLESYVKDGIRQKFGTTEIREAVKIHMRNLAGHLVPYDRARFGEYPAILLDDLQKPKYRMLYRDGTIVSRNDVEDGSSQ